MTRVDSLPCGWTPRADDPCLWLRPVGEWFPLELSEDQSQLVRTPPDQSMADWEGVAAAVHLAQSHPDDPRVTAVGPMELFAPFG